MVKRVIRLEGIRWPVLPGQGWPVTVAADAVELPSLVDVESATITWQSGTKAAQTRDLEIDEIGRTAIAVPAAYSFVAGDLVFLEAPTDLPTEIRAYVTVKLTSGVEKETRETLVLPLNPEFY